VSVTIKVIEEEFSRLHERIGSDNIKLNEWDDSNSKSFYDTDVVNWLEELEKAIKLNIKLIEE
jgi:hypothetical protein